MVVGVCKSPFSKCSKCGVMEKLVTYTDCGHTRECYECCGSGTSFHKHCDVCSMEVTEIICSFNKHQKFVRGSLIKPRDIIIGFTVIVSLMLAMVFIIMINDINRCTVYEPEHKLVIKLLHFHLTFSKELLIDCKAY